MATIEERTGVLGGRRISGTGWILGGLAALALVSVAAAAIVVATAPEPVVPSSGKPAAHGSGSLYTQQELTVMRLIAQGYVPVETLNGGSFLTKRLANRGLLPRQALELRRAGRLPLYTTRERALMAAVAAGIVPRRTLQGEPFRTKRLINQGLIPRAAASS
jgi:hypothetical protein